MLRLLLLSLEALLFQMRVRVLRAVQFLLMFQKLRCAPPFVPISGSSSVSNEGQSSSRCPVPINVPEAKVPGYSSTPSLVLLKDWLSLTSHLFMTQSSCSGLTIGGALSPGPDYIVKMVSKGLFVDFVLLRPCNLPYLPHVPPMEPVGNQLEKLLKCEKTLIYGQFSLLWTGLRPGVGMLPSFFMLKKRA